MIPVSFSLFLVGFVVFVFILCYYLFLQKFFFHFIHLRPLLRMLGNEGDQSTSPAKNVWLVVARPRDIEEKRIRVDGALMGEGWLEFNYCSTFIAGVKERTNQRLVIWKFCGIIEMFLFVRSVASVKRENFRPHSKHLPVSL